MVILFCISICFPKHTIFANAKRKIVTSVDIPYFCKYSGYRPWHIQRSRYPSWSSGSKILRPRYVSNYPYNRKWRQRYTYQVSCYENGARHENSAVNNNASSLHTIMPTQCSFLATMGVALIGVRLQLGSC